MLSIMLACTDAALGQAVVTDERIPSRIRQGLNVESGLNDGICVPLFFIALALAEADEGTLTAHAAAHLVLEEIGYGLVGGVAAGVLGALALRFAARRSLVEPHWLQILTVATAVLAAGIATGLGGSIFIAAFTGGFVFGVIGRDSGGEVSYLVDEGGELLNAVTFIVFGAAILGPALDDLGWEVLVYAVLSLTVVRMLPVALSLLGSGARRPTLAFVGWFGPRGLATIVFAVILIDESALPHERTLLLAVVATIGISVFAHGLSSRPLTNRYVGWYASAPARAAAADGECARGRAPLAQAATARRAERAEHGILSGEGSCIEAADFGFSTQLRPVRAGARPLASTVLTATETEVLHGNSPTQPPEASQEERASLDQLGPVDYLVVEFPAGASNFTGEMAKELLALVDSGTIRVIDILILTKNEDGSVDAMELSDIEDLGPLQAVEAQLAELLAEEDVADLAAAMEPGSTAGVLIWENLWAAPFASAARRSGGQLIADGRIPIQAIIASIEADEAAATEGD